MITTKTTTQGKILTYHEKDHIYDSGHVNIKVQDTVIARVYEDQGTVKIETRGPFCASLSEATEAEAFLKECHEAERNEHSAFKTEVTFTFKRSGPEVQVFCNDMYFGCVQNIASSPSCSVVPGLITAARKWAGWTT